jgi:hypothetical protein
MQPNACCALLAESKPTVGVLTGELMSAQSSSHRPVGVLSAAIVALGPSAYATYSGAQGSPVSIWGANKQAYRHQNVHAFIGVGIPEAS